MPTLSDEKIQEFIDGRLSERETAAVAAILFVDPDLRRKVTRLLLVNEMSSGLGQQILDEPVPERLIQVLRQRQAATDGRPEE